MPLYLLSDSPWQVTETALIAPDLRFEHWRATAFHRLRSDLPSGSSPGAFWGEFRQFDADQAKFCEYASAAIEGVRHERDCANDGRNDFTVYAQLAGVTRAEQDDRQVVVQPGDVLVFDVGRPCRTSMDQHHEVHFLLPRDLVRAAIGTDPGVLGCRVLDRGGIAPFLWEQMRLLAKMAPNLSEDARKLAMQSTVELALSALRRELQRLGSDVRRRQSGLLAAAQMCIKRRLDDSELDVAAIATALRCSRSSLFQAFADAGLTVAGYIREQRLQLSLEQLRGTTGRLPISAVALQAGFVDHAAFSRAFRRRFGVAPRDLRQGLVDWEMAGQIGAPTCRPRITEADQPPSTEPTPVEVSSDL
jgi:AraC-like DNA-binding protein